jgi:hypothetical protein
MMVGYTQIERRYRDILKAWLLAYKMGLPLDKGVAGQLIGDGKLKKIKRLTDRTVGRGRKK